MTRATRFSYLFPPSQRNCAGGGDPSRDAADNSCSFPILLYTNLLWQKKVAVPPLLFFVVVSATLYGLGFLSDRRSLLFPRSRPTRSHRLFLFAHKAAGSNSPFADLDSLKAAIADVVKNEFSVCWQFRAAARYHATCLRL